jgi:hypothetical protein
MIASGMDGWKGIETETVMLAVIVIVIVIVNRIDMSAMTGVQTVV